MIKTRAVWDRGRAALTSPFSLATRTALSNAFHFSVSRVFWGMENLLEWKKKRLRNFMGKVDVNKTYIWGTAFARKLVTKHDFNTIYLLLLFYFIFWNYPIPIWISWCIFRFFQVKICSLALSCKINGTTS